MNPKKKLLSKRYEYDRNVTIPSDPWMIELIENIKIIIHEEEGIFSSNRNCPLCNHENCTILSETEHFGLPLTMQICDNCSLLFSKNYFTKEFSKRYYSSIYNRFKGNKSAEELFQSRTAPSAYSWKRYEYVKSGLGNDFENISVVMEPGCNDGCNLYPYLTDGKEVFGCDFDEERMVIGRNKGINIFQGDIQELLNIGKKADLVILSHLIAHIPHLGSLLDNVRTLLKPDGNVYIESPGFKWNVRSIKKSNRINGSEFGNNFLSFLQFEYVYIFELETLKMYMSKHGYKLLKGDEVIRSIFKMETDYHPETAHGISRNISRGDQVYEYLKNVEKNYITSQSSVKKYFRRLYNFVKK